MNVLVTGGAGYIGSVLCQKLVERQEVEKLIIYDNLSKSNYALLTSSFKNKSKIELIQADILDNRTLKKALDGVDVVYHLVDYKNTDNNAPDSLYESINAWGTAQLSYALEESSVSKIIHLSTLEVYDSSAVTIDKESLPNPQTPYAVSKQRAESYISRLSSKMKVYQLRLAEVIGNSPVLTPKTGFHKLIFDACYKKRVQILGSGNQYYNVLGMESLIRYLLAVLDDLVPEGSHYVLQKSISVLDTVDILKTFIPELEMVFLNHHLNIPSLQPVIDKPFNEVMGEFSIEKEIEKLIAVLT